MVRKAQLVLPVPQVVLALPARLALKEMLVLQARRVFRVMLARLALPAQLAHKVLLVVLVQLVQPAHKALHQQFRVRLALQALKASKVLKAMLGLQDRLALHLT